MATTVERIGIVETKVENLNEKMDELKVDVKDMHDCLDKTREDLKSDLEKMYNASCEQHSSLAKELSELKNLKEKWTYMTAGGIAAAGWLSGHSDKILSLFS
jgi:predicted  nucleic acid-binding Zn-ribbon protein